MTTKKRFYWKWSLLYEAYAVYDTERKNPEGNDYLIASSDSIEFSNAQELCEGLNNGNSELFEQYGIPTSHPVS